VPTQPLPRSYTYLLIERTVQMFQYINTPLYRINTYLCLWAVLPLFKLLALGRCFSLCSYYVATQNSNAVRFATAVQLHVMTSHVLTATQQPKVEWGKHHPRHWLPTAWWQFLSHLLVTMMVITMMIIAMTEKITKQALLSRQRSEDTWK